MASCLVSYDVDSSSSDDDVQENEVQTNSKNLQLCPPILNSAPVVDETMVKSATNNRIIDISQCKELTYNPKFEDMYSPVLGPVNPHKPSNEKKNFLTGSIEPAFVSDVQFELQRKNFHAYGLANNPSDGSKVNQLVAKTTNSLSGATTVESTASSTSTNAEESQIENVEIDSSTVASNKHKSKRKRLNNMDSSDVDGYTGPWAEYEDEVKVAKPTEEEAQELVEILSKRRNTKTAALKSVEEEFKEKAVMHIKDPYDYQGRSFLYPPHDVDVPLHRADHTPNRCFLPKKLLHTFTGHTKQVTAIRLFPVTGHLLLSCSMDSKIKLWEVYHERRCIMTFHGHKQAIRDICFNRRGDRFISAGYDRYIKLWDTETGQCVRRFTNRKIAYSVRFNTADEAHSHYFLSGMSDKKILCWDTRSGNIVQEYDRHLGAVNTVTLVDGGRRFVSTSDDKSLRVWDWDIPVDVKYIAEPSMHAIPAVTASPTGKWLACQFMDNKIQAFACMNRFKLNQKKIFTGHMVAGYACSPDFSPDMSYLISGDADGKLFIWDWKTTKLLTSFQAHENVCISALWHPHETSKVITAGWDNVIKLWD